MLGSFQEGQKIVHPTLQISSMFHAAGIDAGGVGKDLGFIIGMVLVFLLHESFILKPVVVWNVACKYTFNMCFSINLWIYSMNIYRVRIVSVIAVLYQDPPMGGV